MTFFNGFTLQRKHFTIRPSSQPNKLIFCPNCSWNTVDKKKLFGNVFQYLFCQISGLYGHQNSRAFLIYFAEFSATWIQWSCMGPCLRLVGATVQHCNISFLHGSPCLAFFFTFSALFKQLYTCRTVFFYRLAQVMEKSLFFLMKTSFLRQ